VLHRKLLLVLGPLIVLLLAMAVGATLLLNAALADLDRVSQSSLQRTAQVAAIGATLTTIESELVALRLQTDASLDRLLDSAETIHEQVVAMETRNAETEAPTAAALEMRQALDRLMARLGEIAAGRNQQVIADHARIAGDDAIALREAIVEMGDAARLDDQAQNAALMARFRGTVLALCLAFLVVLNVSIVVLLRAASMVLRPVAQLVQASRHLACEEFDYRTPVDRQDEFGELARATNSMAEQLGRSEQRKLETLHQVARTLSHELRNAMAIIDLQLELVARTAGGDPQQEQRLREIHQALVRMSGTVDALTRVRRIVLTDYVAGLKMLDLERSVAVETSASPPVARQVAETDSA
jgi:nitrate/nitrite-specific signal transduction histidine kinase